MKLRKSEWVAIAITAAFLLVVIGIRIGGANHSAPVTVRTEQPQASVLVTPAPDSAKPLPQRCWRPMVKIWRISRMEN